MTAQPCESKHRDREILDQLYQICQQAGDAIMAVYNRNSDLAVQTKADSSPVTEADLAAHEVIERELLALTPEIPVLSEESETGIPDFTTRQQWPRYWLIDPLDGTKEFIHKSPDFTVNIALIEAGRAVLGCVYIPAQKVAYLGFNYLDQPAKAEKILANGARQAIATRAQTDKRLTLVASKRHGAGAVETLVAKLSEQFQSLDYKSIGSSLKLCLIAEGAADIYPRLAPTCEWDTAAAQAVVEAAGGLVLNDQMETLTYNQKDSLLNPHFYVLGDASWPWGNSLL